MDDDRLDFAFALDRADVTGFDLLVMWCVIGLGWSYRKTGKKVHISHSRVRQIYKKFVEAMKNETI